MVADLRDGAPMLQRRHLEACVFSGIAQELKTGDLAVEGSDEYADYREQLLTWEEGAPLVEEHCRELGLEPTPEGFVAQLKLELSETAREVDRLYPENAGVAISADGEPVLKEAKARKPTRALKDLETSRRRWPRACPSGASWTCCARASTTRAGRATSGRYPARSPS